MICPKFFVDFDIESFKEFLSLLGGSSCVLVLLMEHWLGQLKDTRNKEFQYGEELLYDFIKAKRFHKLINFYAYPVNSDPKREKVNERAPAQKISLLGYDVIGRDHMLRCVRSRARYYTTCITMHKQRVLEGFETRPYRMERSHSTLSYCR